MEFPSQSPDLNPVEQAAHALKPSSLADKCKKRRNQEGGR